MKKILISIFAIFVSFIYASNNLFIWVYSEGKGEVEILWLPSKIWPEGGWRIEKVKKGKKEVLKDKILPLSQKEYLKNISKSEYEKVLNFANELKNGKIKGDKVQLAKIILGVKAISEKNFGYVLGLRYKDSSKDRGKRYYIVYALNKNGKVIGKAKSIEIDPYKRSKPPKAVSGAKAISTIDGVKLYWKKPKLDKKNPVIGYKVARVDNDGSMEWVTKKIKVVSNDVFKKSFPVVIDKNAPLETEVKYKIYSVGYFENLSEPKTVKVYIKDFEALMPPVEFKAEGKVEKVELSWKKSENENCYGYIIERSQLQKGPFLVITPKGVKKDKNRYEDKNVIGGISYFYRVRSVNKDGEVGIPSIIRSATPVSKNPPSSPRNLKANVGKTLITLKWEKPKKGYVAGYIIYRKAVNANKWMQLNSYLIKEEFFEDPYDSNTYGEFEYKVVAVGYDSKMSKPSNIVKVELIDQVPPNPPIITAVDPSDGKVKISFKSSPPYEDIEKFYLVRSVSVDDPGLVIGDAIPKNKKEVTDNFVKYGQRYWYALVAVDKVGNRSDLSRRVSVVVEPPKLPTPKKPKVKLKLKPVIHTLITVKNVPKRAVALIYKSSDKKIWDLVGTIDKAGKVVDTKIGKNRKLFYRVVFKSEAGNLSEPSKIVEVTIK